MEKIQIGKIIIIYCFSFIVFIFRTMILRKQIKKEKHTEALKKHNDIIAFIISFINFSIINIFGTIGFIITTDNSPESKFYIFIWAFKFLFDYFICITFTRLIYNCIIGEGDCQLGREEHLKGVDVSDKKPN